MKPYYERDGITLYHADCREVLPTLAPGSVDAVITDPPFGVRTDEAWDVMSESEFCRFSMAWLAECRRITPNLAAFYASGMPFMKLCEFIYPRTRQLVWYKPLGSQYAGSSDCRMWYAYEPIAHCWEPERWEVVEPKSSELATLIRTARERKGMSRGGVDQLIRGKKTGLCYRWEESACIPTPEQAAKLKTILDMNGEFAAALERAYSARDVVLEKAAEKAAERSDVFEHRTVTSAIHPCEKPVGLLEDIIASITNEGDTFADPFSGVATTGVAAWNLSRKAILCEISEEYCELGAARLDRTISQGRLFKPEPAVITQRSMFEGDE